MVLSGAGVGGGSLVYANTLYEPLPAFYNDPQWAHITDWKDEQLSAGFETTSSSNANAGRTMPRRSFAALWRKPRRRCAASAPAACLRYC